VRVRVRVRVCVRVRVHVRVRVRVHVHAHLVEAELRLEDPDAMGLLGRALPVELEVVLTKPPRRGLQRRALSAHREGARGEAAPGRVAGDGVERVEAARRLEPAVTRQMFEAKAAGFVTSNVVARADLKAGDCIPGPAVITENETTTIITDGQEAIFQADGCLLVRSKA